MAKSPKRSASSDGSEAKSDSKKPKLGDSDALFGESEPTFDFGTANVNDSLDTTSADFSTELPTPFDNFMGEDQRPSLALPNNAKPTTNLVNKPSGNVDLALPAKKEPNDKKKKKEAKKESSPAQLPPDKSSGIVPLNKGTQQQQQQQQQQQTKLQSDPDKLSDALLSAGVNIREEEALLTSTVSATKSNAQVSNSQIPEHPPFLHPVHVAQFMKKVANEQNFNQDFSKNSDILGFMSTACEMFIKDIVTNSLVISRHRRRAVKLNAGRRSEVSRALRDLALQQKQQEERRVKKRISMGLEKETAEAKLDTEETLHRASNATANMMITGGKKKYSWLTAGSKPAAPGLKATGKVSSAVAARGDLGIRYREAREEPGIVMRDLLHALENRRVGVNNVISKGYARIRD